MALHVDKKNLKLSKKYHWQKMRDKSTFLRDAWKIYLLKEEKKSWSCWDEKKKAQQDGKMINFVISSTHKEEKLSLGNWKNTTREILWKKEEEKKLFQR